MTHSMEKNWSLVRLCVVFFVITTALFLAMILFVLLPKIDSTFSRLSNDATKTTAKAYAEKLDHYLHTRELALVDLASNALITHTSLMGEGDNPAFLDYIQHTTLLGEDPVITSIDAAGDVLYTEATHNIDYQWVLPVLDMKVGRALRIIEDNIAPLFEIAVPIIYGKRAEGVLIARIQASPEMLYGKVLIDKKNVSVSYSKNKKMVSSDTISSKRIHKEVFDIPYWDINFTYTVNYQPVLDKENEVARSFILSTTFGSLFLFMVLFFIGRKIIIRPFQELVNLQQAISLAVEGMSRIDPQGRYITLNEAYAGAAGYTPEELEGQPWSTTVYKEDMPALNNAYKIMLKDGKVVAEARGIKKDGSIFYKQVTMISQHDKSGKFIGHHCFLKDISTRKATEEKIRKQQQDLQLIFDNVPVKIWYKDDKNTILRLNKKAAETMGGVVADFEGKDTYDLFPEMAKKYHEADLEVINSKKPLLNIVEKYTPLNAPAGWVSTDKIPYTDPDTNQEFVFVCAQDITSLKNAEIEQARLVDRLSNTNRELEQFAYIASHDLKSPLRGVEQLASWIVKDCADLIPSESQKHLTLLVNRVQRMSRLLDDLLSYSHASRLDLSEDTIDLKGVLNELLDLHVQPFAFSYVLDVPDGDVVISRKPMEMVIRNLLDNAVKHHDKSKGHIVIRYRSTNSAHLIDIVDDGPGIDPSMHDKAFQLFQTLQSRDDVEGSGMGLAIIKKILQRHNGSISIASDGIRGTTFKIIWPFKKA